LEKQAFNDYLQVLNEQSNNQTSFVESRNSYRASDNWFTILCFSLTIFQRVTNKSLLFVPHNVSEAIVTGSYVIGHICVWLLLIYTVRKARKVFPDPSQSFKRFAITSSIGLAVFFSINMATVHLADYLMPADAIVISPKIIGQYFAKIVLGTWMIVGMYEAIYQQSLLKETQRQKRELQRMQMQQQLDNLKGKVNPHFLFNSLNTLSSLIYTNAEKAERFVEELSAVYRYLLRNYEDDMATLKEEIDFINSYFILVKIRFGDAICTTINIDETLHCYKLPAISLQLLIENAIKHNVVSKETPLHISISTNNRELVVKNNLQRKPQTLPSEKMGLNYIITKYAMVHLKGVEIDDKQDEFIVRLPLIKPSEPIETTHIYAQNPVSIHE